MKVLQLPLAKITIIFVLGILAAYFLKANTVIVFSILGISTILFSIAYYSFKTNRKSLILFGITTYLLAFSIGITTQTIHNESIQKNNYTHYKNIFDKKHTFTLTLREKLKNTTYNERYIAQLNTIDGQKITGKIQLNIYKKNLNHSFIIGNKLKINTLLNKNTAQKNPNQFDYSKYLENKQIYGQLNAKPNQIELSTEIEKNIWYYSAILRTRIVQNLEKQNFNSKELNVVIALIMGQRQDIDPKIIQDYQYAGAVHILAVSGLHIGFILLFVTFLLKPIPNTKKGSFIKLIITLISLFLFGVLTGLSPSVVRAITMFSFVAIGQHLRRSSNIYHTLLVSILLILLVQPSFLFDVGFQLSYFAVFFIIWLQPLLLTIWQPKNKILKYFRDIITVTIAAQIGTLPLSLYYFHQFPGLFFITNIIVLPFLGFIMCLGVFVMFLAAFNWVPYYPSKALELSIYYLDKIISLIASFDQFVFKNIPINTSLLITSYLVIITLIIAVQEKNIRSIYVALITIITFQLSIIATKYEVQHQSEFIVLNTSKKTNLIERNGTLTTLYSNDSDSTKTNTVASSYITANFSYLGKLSKVKNLYYFKGNKILLIDSSMTYPKNIDPDIILLTQSPKINLHRLLLTIQPKIIVADASNYKSIQQKWALTCLQQKISFHSTNEKGFFKIN
jgi:competence protein ComEC